MAHIPGYEENQPRKQKRRIAWPMENYKKMPRNKVAVIEPLPRNKSGEVTQVSAVSGVGSGNPEESNKIFDENTKTSMTKSNTSVLKKETAGNGNYPRFHNREKDARFARMKKNLKVANANGGRKMKSTKKRQSSGGDSPTKRNSTTSSSSSSSDGTPTDDSDAGSIPIPIHFKHDKYEFTKIVFSNVLEKDKLKYNRERSQ